MEIGRQERQDARERQDGQMPHPTCPFPPVMPVPPTPSHQKSNCALILKNLACVIDSGLRYVLCGVRIVGPYVV
jgi:hypothetical protein